jgi:hypothetical protein
MSKEERYEKDHRLRLMTLEGESDPVPREVGGFFWGEGLSDDSRAGLTGLEGSGLSDVSLREETGSTARRRRPCPHLPPGHGPDSPAHARGRDPVGEEDGERTTPDL